MNICLYCRAPTKSNLYCSNLCERNDKDQEEHFAAIQAARDEEEKQKMNNILCCEVCGDYYSLKYLTECPRCKERKERNTKAQEQEAAQQELLAADIAYLMSNWNKQSITDVLLWINNGRLSARKAAELLERAAFTHHCTSST